ncbi:PREDICTED: uncharacterized protein LOC107171052, partial [Diuraphis noxia]|uniref:uncharacterized protein LOC107171052 n=1 Tax=Diuraphis noxia TaxID=143948 RepID=UPI0007636AB8
KLKEYCTIFQQVALLQIFITSTSHIIIWFVAAMSFREHDLGDSSFILKLVAVHPLISFQLFLTCFVFGSIIEKKDSIIFALYSSNWTEMDIKCKKLILLAMEINSASRVKLQITNTKIVNLEMFTQNNLNV